MRVRTVHRSSNRLPLPKRSRSDGVDVMRIVESLALLARAYPAVFNSRQPSSVEVGRCARARARALRALWCAMTNAAKARYLAAASAVRRSAAKREPRRGQDERRQRQAGSAEARERSVERLETGLAVSESLAVDSCGFHGGGRIPKRRRGTCHPAQ